MNTDGTLFSMKKNSREAEVMSMTSFMIPITTESPAQAWALAYRAAWNDALDFCIQAEQALDKKEDK